MEQDYLNDPEFQELVREYIQYLSDNLVEIKEDLNNSDYLKVQKFGHNLKGSGGGYGLMEMSKIGQKIEEAAISHELNLLNELITQFEVDLKSAKIKYSVE